MFKCFVIIIMIPNEEALFIEVWGKKSTKPVITKLKTDEKKKKVL